MAKSLNKCIYKVEKGIFGFESKKERDEFLKNPEFDFEFDSSIFEDNPSEDKKILKKIFGSLDFNPIFLDEMPKFKVTNLEKNDNPKNSILIDVEVEMSFEIFVDDAKFNEWDQEMIRFAGRITPNMSDSFTDSAMDGFEWY